MKIIERKKNQRKEYLLEKVEGKWLGVDKKRYIKIRSERKPVNMEWYSGKEAMLLNLDEGSRIEKEIVKELGISKKPKVIIIDGVDGVGKSSIVGKLIEEFRKEGKKVVVNTFKRRRTDNKRFREQKEETEWEFRKEVVEQINRRMVEYEDEDIIILDKSPYSEYFYQRTASFDRGLISGYQNHLIEKEIFKYKEIIDNATVIFLENERCWDNYHGRETKKFGEGHKTSYELLNKERYMEMVEAFKKYQNVYKDTGKYFQVKIKNDDKSWETVYWTINIPDSNE
jgi:thymidylate kinase